MTLGRTLRDCTRDGVVLLSMLRVASCMVSPYLAANRSQMSKSNTRANFSTLSSETFRSWRSIDPTYVRCNWAISARASCEIPRAARSARRCRANLARAFSETPGLRDMAAKIAVQMTLGLQT